MKGPCSFALFIGSLHRSALIKASYVKWHRLFSKRKTFNLIKIVLQRILEIYLIKLNLILQYGILINGM